MVFKFISQKVKIGTQPLYKFLKKNKLLPGVRYLELPIKKICKEYKSGMKVEDLAIKYKVNPKTITFRLKENKIRMRNSKEYVTKIIKNLAFHYKDLIKTPKLLSTKAKELDVHKNTLRSKFKDAGYKLRSKSEEQMLLNDLKNPNLNINFFKKKGPERDYWVGFIGADGAVIELNKKKEQKLRLVLTLGKKDKDHCYKLQKILRGGSVSKFDFSKYDGKYKSEKIKNVIKGGITYKYQLDKTSMCRDLVKLGVTPRKSHSFKPDKSLIFSYNFWRGIIDGDGSLTNLDKTRSTNLALGTGSINEFKAYLTFLKKNKINNPIIQKKKNIGTIFHVITISGKRARKLAKLLYKNTNKNQRLDRKYNLFLQWKKRRHDI